MRRKCAEIDIEVFAFDETGPLQFIKKSSRRIGRLNSDRIEEPKAIGPPRLLSQYSERPCDTRAKKADKLTPSHRFPQIPKRYRVFRLARFGMRGGRLVCVRRPFPPFRPAT